VSFVAIKRVVHGFPIQDARFLWGVRWASWAHTTWLMHALRQDVVVLACLPFWPLRGLNFPSHLPFQSFLYFRFVLKTFINTS